MAPTQARWQIWTDLPRATISPNIYGHFAEHLGRYIDEGIWVGPDSPIPNRDGLRLDTIEALRALPTPVIRWPGGCFADEYHWEDGIGPREQRRRGRNIWWHAEDSNQFGTDEFVAFSRLVGAEPYICTNVGSGTPEEALNWLDYCNGSGTTYYTELRRRNGHPEPYQVRFWGVGNESWGCGGKLHPGGVRGRLPAVCDLPARARRPDRADRRRRRRQPILRRGLEQPLPRCARRRALPAPPALDRSPFDPPLLPRTKRLRLHRRAVLSACCCLAPDRRGPSPDAGRPELLRRISETDRDRGGRMGNLVRPGEERQRAGADKYPPGCGDRGGNLERVQPLGRLGDHGQPGADDQRSPMRDPDAGGKALADPDLPRVQALRGAHRPPGAPGRAQRAVAGGAERRRERRVAAAGQHLER